jgi:hypothetical protein
MMMHPVLRLAQHRADAAALVEYLEGMAAGTDREENAAHGGALRRAHRALQVAEQLYSTAIATYSDAELEALGLQKAA